MAAPLNILAVSLESGKRHKAYAVYDGDRLALTHCLPIVGPPSQWAGELREEIEDKDGKGFVVSVEDRTEAFCTGDASVFSFEEMVDGRSMLYHALDHHFALLDMGKIIADKAVERFLIRSGGEGSRIERRQDEKGRTIYAVDWNAFNGGHKACLMCVCAAMMRPLSERFLEAVYGPLEGEGKGKEFDPDRAWNAITMGAARTEIAKWSDYYEDGF